MPGLASAGRHTSGAGQRRRPPREPTPSRVQRPAACRRRRPPERWSRGAAPQDRRGAPLGGRLRGGWAARPSIWEESCGSFRAETGHTSPAAGGRPPCLARPGAAAGGAPRPPPAPRGSLRDELNGGGPASGRPRGAPVARGAGSRRGAGPGYPGRGQGPIGAPETLSHPQVPGAPVPAPGRPGSERRFAGLGAPEAGTGRRRQPRDPAAARERWVPPPPPPPSAHAGAARRRHNCGIPAPAPADGLSATALSGGLLRAAGGGRRLPLSAAGRAGGRPGPAPLPAAAGGRRAPPRAVTSPAPIGGRRRVYGAPRARRPRPWSRSRPRPPAPLQQPGKHGASFLPGVPAGRATAGLCPAAPAT